MKRQLPVDPRISVVVCTRNRAQQLGSLLSSFERLEIPASLSWELVIVDNGSEDRTSEVIEAFASALPVRGVREDRAGLSHARNKGVEEARGEYICWTDDDVVLDSNWLAAYASAFERHPEAAVFGGRILPVLEGPTPRWFDRFKDSTALASLLAKRDFGDAEAPLSLEEGRMPWGANFAVRTSEQRQVRYDPELGVSPVQRRLGEESDVMRQIMMAGSSGWWVPDSKVHHLIPAKRQSLAYAIQYFRSLGESYAYLEARDGRRFPSIEGPPDVLRRRARRAYCEFLFWRILGRWYRTIASLRRYAEAAGAADFKAAARP